MKLSTFFFTILMASSAISSSQGVETTHQTNVVPTPESFHDYKALSAFLQAYVTDNGNVNYSAIRKNKAKLDAIVQSLRDNTPKDSWSRDQKLAYWINVYNVFTIQLVVNHYPVSSITKITAKPWDKKFIEIGGKTYSLNNIEHDIVRKQFKEPRIHFALNCASESCPILYNSAFRAKVISYQLSQQTKKFLNDKSKNDFSNSSSIKISKIFEWYRSDFDSSGGVVGFINKYSDHQLSKPKVSYLDYKWGLNE